MAAEIKALFEGNWTCHRSENAAAFADKIGAPDSMRQMMLSDDVNIQIRVQGEDIMISGNMGPRAYNVSFVLDKENTMQGEYTQKGISTFSGGIMTTVLTPKDASKPLQTISRRIVNGEMVQTVQVEDTVATRYFKRA